MNKTRKQPLSFQEVLDLIDEWLKRGGDISLGHHLPKDRPWRNISRRDCLYVIENGYLSWPPETDSEYGNDVYHICRRDLDDELLEIVFYFDFENGIIRVITAKPR